MGPSGLRLPVSSQPYLPRPRAPTVTRATWGAVLQPSSNEAAKEKKTNKPVVCAAAEPTRRVLEQRACAQYCSCFILSHLTMLNLMEEVYEGHISCLDPHNPPEYPPFPLKAT